MSDRYKRIATFLLVLTSIFFTLSLCLGGYWIANYYEINRLRAQLMNRKEIQEELLDDTESTYVLYPHRKGYIGYVLNPLMKEGTLWAAEGESYPINSLGLRGKEIKKKPGDVTRILLLGDSWLFGWFLKEEDRIGNRLQELIDEKLPSQKYEIVTAALPGWNVQCEAAFLKNHIHRIDPDYILWETMANDVLDAGGASPPGILTRFYSPQSPIQTPFTTLGKLINYPMPFVLNRIRRNFNFMVSSYERYDVPILVFSVDVDPALYSMALGKDTFPFPIVLLPETYKHDRERAWIKPNDFHPSPWLTKRVALGLSAHFSGLEWVSPLELDITETSLADEFVTLNDIEIPRERIEAYQRKYADWTEVELHEDNIQPNVGFGLAHRDKMCQRGILYLRIPENRDTVTIVFELEEMFLNYPHQVTFFVRDFEGKKTKAEFTIEEMTHACKLKLPQPRTAYSLYEIEWTFDYCECASPILCYSATLKHIFSE